jgi:hypothetical protein
MADDTRTSTVVPAKVAKLEKRAKKARKARKKARKARKTHARKRDAERVKPKAVA